jgi:methylmalonyl-CoA mutase cobalamin-binding subunit
MKRDGIYVDRTGAVRTAEDFERYAVRESIARYAGVCGLASAAASMLAGFGLRSR